MKTRNYGLTGIGLLVVGLLLGRLVDSGIYSVAIFLWIFIIAGTFTALYGAVRAGSTWTSIIIAGVIYGVGLFYADEPHDVHVGSGLGFDLSQETDVAIGIVLVTWICLERRSPLRSSTQTIRRD